MITRNKTSSTLKLIVYYKAAKVEPPEVHEILRIEPKKKISLMVDKEYTGIYCDVLYYDEPSTNGRLGWAFDYFIEKGFTQKIIGQPDKRKQEKDQITEKTEKNL